MTTEYNNNINFCIHTEYNSYTQYRIDRMRLGTRPIYTDNEYNVFTRFFEVQKTIIILISVFIQNTIRRHTTV